MLAQSTDRVAIVADDSAVVRDIVRSALGPRWRIYVARDGVEAVEFARTTHAELVLLDIRMPRMDGIEACTRIRDLPTHATTPIIMVTAYDEPAIRQRASQSGATAVFAKPIAVTQLQAGIAPLLAACERAAAPATGMAEPSPDNSDLARGLAALAVCRQAEAAAKVRPQFTFADTMRALHEESRR